MRLIKWRDIHLGAYHQSLQHRYGNDSKRQRAMDMELHGIKRRNNSKLLCKYSEVDGNGVGGRSRGCSQPCNSAGKQQYANNRYDISAKRIYGIGRRHLWRITCERLFTIYLYDECDNRQLLGDSYIHGKPDQRSMRLVK